MNICYLLSGFKKQVTNFLFMQKFFKSCQIKNKIKKTDQFVCNIFRYLFLQKRLDFT